MKRNEQGVLTSQGKMIKQKRNIINLRLQQQFQFDFVNKPMLKLKLCVKRKSGFHQTLRRIIPAGSGSLLVINLRSHLFTYCSVISPWVSAFLNNLSR